MSTNSIAKSTGIVLLFTVFARAIGFGRDVLLTSKLGILPIADVYSIAFSIPPVLLAFMGISTMSGTVTSTFAELIEAKDFDRLSNSFSSLLNLILVYGTIICLLFSLSPSILSKMFASGFSPEKSILLQKLIFLILILIIARGISLYLNAVLVSLKNFSVTSFPLAIPNILVCFALLYFPVEEIILHYLIWANILGFLIYISFFQMPQIFKSGVKFKFTLDTQNPNVRKILKLTFPLLFTMGSVQLALMVDKAIASYFEDGAVTALRVSATTTKMFYNLLILPLFGVFLSFWSEFSAKKDWKGLEKSFFEIAEMLIFIACLIAIVFVASRNEILSVLYERGNFDKEAVSLTSEPMIYYSFEMIFNCVYLLYNYLFLAVQKNKILGIAGTIAFLLNIVLSFLISRFMGFTGIALATAFTSLIYSFILFRASKEVLPNALKGFFNSSKVILLGLGVGISAYWVANLNFPLVNFEFNLLNSIFNGALKSALIVSLFLVLTYIFKCSKLGTVYQFVRKKVFAK